MRYARILSEFYGRAWAVPQDLLLRMDDLLRQQAAGMKWCDTEVIERIARANAQSGYEVRGEQLGFRYYEIGAAAAVALAPNRSDGDYSRSSGMVAVLPITGVIAHRINLLTDISGGGGTSIQRLQAQLRQALGADQVRAIVFDVDSPGGSVDGVPELAEEIYQARKTKPMIAVVNTMCASAAYWLASAAGEVVGMPSSQSGSIGVYWIHEDLSRALDAQGIRISIIKAGKFKTEGNPTEPLSDEGRDNFQRAVDHMYALFINAVAKNRGATQAQVRTGYGQGRTLLAQDALRENLIDRIGTFDSVLAKLGVGTMAPNRNSFPALGQRGAKSELLRYQLDLERLKLGMSSEDYLQALERRRSQLEMLGGGKYIAQPRVMLQLLEAAERRRALMMFN